MAGVGRRLVDAAGGPCQADLVVVLGFAAGLALGGGGYLGARDGWFWRTGPGLPVGVDPPLWPEVTAVVPARDEAALLPQTLPSLLAQGYPGRFRVVVVDDGSADGTAAVAARLGRGAAIELCVVRAGDRPAGWAGKVWAMAEGVRAAGAPEFVLFTDADIVHAPGTLTRLVRVARDDGHGEGYDLVSLLATLRTRTAWERAIVPAFVYFFALLYPFRRGRRAGAGTPAGARGGLLVG